MTDAQLSNQPASAAWANNPWSKALDRANTAPPRATVVAAAVQSAPKVSEVLRDTAGNLAGVRYNEAGLPDPIPLALDCSGTRFVATWPPSHFATHAGKAELRELLNAQMRPQIARLFGDRVAEGQVQWVIQAAHSMFVYADAGLQNGCSVSLPTSTPLGIAEAIRDCIGRVIAERAQDTTCRAVAAMVGALGPCKSGE